MNLQPIRGGPSEQKKKKNSQQILTNTFSSSCDALAVDGGKEMKDRKKINNCESDL